MGTDLFWGLTPVDKWGLTPLFGGAEEDRTPDLRIANATLSQLSYRPMACEYMTAGPIFSSQCTRLSFALKPARPKAARSG